MAGTGGKRTLVYGDYRGDDCAQDDYGKGNGGNPSNSSRAVGFLNLVVDQSGIFPVAAIHLSTSF